MVRRNCKNIFVFLIFLFAFAERGNSQTLAVTSLNLNSGGVIYDVADDPYHDCYIIVGSFTTVNSIPCSNIAFINKSDLSLNTSDTLNSINTINGEIRSVEVYTYETFSHWNTRLYLGGNFSSIQTNGDLAVTRNGFVELVSQKSKLLPITETAFSISSWNILMYDAIAEIGVNDIYRSNDTLILVGTFDFTTSGQPYNLLFNVISFKAVSHTWIPIFNNAGGSGAYGYDCGLCQVFSIERFGSNYYLAGDDDYISGGAGFLRKYDLNGNYISSFQPTLCGTGDGVWTSIPVVSGPDSIIVSSSRSSGVNYLYVHDLIDNVIDGPVLCQVTNVFTPNADGLTNYKNTIITRSQSQVNFYDMNGTYPAISNYSINTNATSYTTSLGGLAASHPYGGLGYRRLHVIDNYLFVTGNLLTTVNATPRVGLAVYCLEPADAKFFTTSDSTICATDTITYTIPPVDFADGYLWEYTGNGAFLVDYGPLAPTIDIGSSSGNSIQVAYLPNCTPGQLKVTPYSLCNGIKMYSNTITTNIISNPLPHVNAGPDTSLTCFNDTLVLYGYSDSAVVSYEWIYPNIFDNVPGQYDTIETNDEYIFKVVNPLGCPNYDTVSVSYDTITPVPILPLGPYELTCAIPVKDFLGSTLASNTTSYWIDLSDTLLVHQSNPISIDAEGGFQFIVQDTLNGCFQPVGIYVDMNIVQPTIVLPDYPVFDIGNPIDEILCNPNFLSLVCASSTANTTSTWINSDTTLFFGDTMIVTNPGNYTAFATDNNNGCTNSLTINIAAFQNTPGIELFGDDELNCSVDSLILDASSLTAGALIEWSGTTIPTTPNPVVIYNPGTYYLTVTNPDNGCVSTDSTVISETNSINVSAGNNLLACDQDFVNLTATYTGNITGINYLWNTGTTTSNEIYTAGNSPYGAVEVFGDNGCYGVDTVYINLPPTPVINFQGFKPCDDGPSGQIVATPVSGTEPFQYSIDGGVNYQTSPVFGGLYIGTYPIWVKDSLLCDYQFEAVIDENSSLPEPKFLFSTYNFASDTIVIIDVSNPPTDSTSWEFPTEIIVLDYNALSPTILLPDTGVFQITMKAYYGNCLVELTKPIYAAMFDSTAANNYNQNGIKSIELYPNPTSGNFTVTVEFYKSQRAAMIVQDMIGNTYVFNEYEETLTISQDIFLDLSVQDGTYVLKLISEFDSAYITFILAR